MADSSNDHRTTSTRVAILGSGNIGTDLMYKVLRSPTLELIGFVGIDANSEGLARARQAGVETSTTGINWMLERSGDISIVFEATSAWVHRQHAPKFEEAGIRVIDLTPARIGPVVVPPVNLGDHVAASNLNLITCGGQATVPIVYSVNKVTPVVYSEIVSTVASRSAGPGTRQNIDEFTTTTASALTELGGAARSKAIVVLNPAEPPILMRNTVMCSVTDDFDEDAVKHSINNMVAEVASYVPGYRLKAEPVFEYGVQATPEGARGCRIVVLLEVEGAGDFLPIYAGNLDIMTAAAVKVAEALPSMVMSE
jgi:acetaldehyde dehydrogenase